MGLRPALPTNIVIAPTIYVTTRAPMVKPKPPKRASVEHRLARATRFVKVTPGCVPHACLAESEPNEQTLNVAWLASQAVTAPAPLCPFRPLAMLANQAFLPEKKLEHVHLAELEHTPH